MANDFLNLAQLSVPRMAPDATYGSGLYSGMDYQAQQASHQQDLGQARSLAGLSAEMDQQKQREYMAGAPGRQAETEVGNAVSQNKLSNLPKILEGAGETLDANTAQTKQKRLEAVDKTLEPYISEWMKATSPKGKQDVLEAMRADGITKIGNRDLSEVDPERLDALMKQRFSGRYLDTPTQQNKMAVEGEKNYRYGLAANARVESANVMARAKVEVEKLKEKLAKEKPEVVGNWEAREWKRMAIPGEMTELEREVFIKYQTDKNANAAARAGNAPPNVNPDIAPGVLTPPNVPRPAPIPGPPPKENTKKKQAAGKDGKMYDIVDETTDGSHVKLSNGEVVKVK